LRLDFEEQRLDSFCRWVRGDGAGLKLAGFCVAKTATAYAILIYCPEQSISGCAAVESESEGDAGLELSSWQENKRWELP